MEVPCVELLPQVQTDGCDVVCNEIHVCNESESDSGIDDSIDVQPCVPLDRKDVSCADADEYCAATVPPMHLEEEKNNEQARVVVLETCAQLLLNVEAIKLSLLQLQYSVHAGDIGTSNTEAKIRSHQLWSWDKRSVETEVDSSTQFQLNVFPCNAVEELTLPKGIYDVFEGGCITIDTEPPDAESGALPDLSDPHNAEGGL